jgi:hypothetical protein
MGAGVVLEDVLDAQGIPPVSTRRYTGELKVADAKGSFNPA